MLQLAELIERVKSYHPQCDTDLIAKAYEYSMRAHEGQKRKSGDPYFVHPASVAGIITELKLDGASVCAALLHDVVEDTLATHEDIQAEFGLEIADLVDGVTNQFHIQRRPTGRELPQNGGGHGSGHPSSVGQIV
jgi:GTP diphosphokinase / guanosine-3',5'-bis(diphosphate) 3'-diphosphatase